MNIKPIERFWRLLSTFKPEIKQIYIYAISNGLVNLTLPLGIQAIINYIQTGGFSSSWFILVSFVLLGIRLAGFMQLLQLRIVENMQQNLFTRSAFEFAFRMTKISVKKLDKIHAPELVNRFFDTLTIQKGLPKILIDFSLAIFQIVFGLILLAIYSPYFIVLGVALIFILWVIYKITGLKGLKTSLKESKHKYELAHWLEEVGRVNRSFKLYASNKLHLEKTDEIVGKYLSARENHFQVLLQQFKFFILFKIFIAASLLVLGSYLVFEEQMDLGQFVAAEIIILLILNSVEKVIGIVEGIYDVLTALEKIGYVTDLELDDNQGAIVVEPDADIAIKATDISFGFEEDRKNVFEDLSFEIRAKQKVVLEGKSGTGKTLLLQVLAGIHQIDSGELCINNIPYVYYDREKLFQQFGVSLPSNQLFEGTIRENICMGRSFPEKRLSEVLRFLCLDEFVANRPQGVDGLIDSGGRRLPRSIIQKLTLARIIMSKPKLLLLEDPLLHIQEEEKVKIVDFLMDTDRDWTVC
jgi:ABC-type bacteriocin/lantibiotic exporter with double-glycine peptidase domain